MPSAWFLGVSARLAAGERGINYETFRREHRARWARRLAGWDITCRCGYETRTGGAIRARVSEDHLTHILDAILEHPLTPNYAAILKTAKGDN